VTCSSRLADRDRSCPPKTSGSWFRADPARTGALFLPLVSITGMDERAPAEQRLVALREVLLAFYDEHTSVLSRQRPKPKRRERLVNQVLQRLRLQWLVVLVTITVGAVRSMRTGTPVFGDVWPVARAYRELAGTDPQVARAEVWRMMGPAPAA